MATPTVTQSAFNAVKSAGLRIAEKLSSVPKESTFKENGKLTPDEFVQAGDYLVFHCRTWSWVGVKKQSKRKSYLPENKQFLQAKNVPCYKRSKQVEEMHYNEQILQLSADDEGWVDTHHGINLEEEAEDISVLAPQLGKVSISHVTPSGDQGDDEDSDDDGPIGSLEDFLDEPPDPAVVQQPKLKATKGATSTRTYDLNITYDNYYNTPRLWLFGYDENGKALVPEQMYEDVSMDHLHKTVTLEPHPHVPPPDRLSVHPCRHAEVMKKIMSVVEEDGRELKVHTYLLVFLKFVQSVIPTIEYDYTKQLSLAT